MGNIINIEIHETYCVNNKIKVLDNKQIISINNNTIKGINIGKATLLINNIEYEINVLKENALSDSFTLSYERLANKNLLVIGDSVSAQATIKDGKTYSTLLKEACNMNILDNQAICGTTLTYMYENSNIDKEYHDNKDAIDGCRVIKKLEDENKLKDYDYVIIAFGHNDLYFQTPLDEENIKFEQLNDIHSFKNSYRYIINKLKKNNPNVRIIILNCTYSEYANALSSPYGKNITYQSLRKASEEIAKDYSIKIIDPWDYMKQFFDYETNKFYYQDSVHLSKNGHVKLFEFILNK